MPQSTRQRILRLATFLLFAVMLYVISTATAHPWLHIPNRFPVGVSGKWV